MIGKDSRKKKFDEINAIKSVWLCDYEPPSLDKKLVSRKLCKKSSSKKKKTKGPPWLLRTLGECKDMDSQTEGQSNSVPRCNSENKKNSQGRAQKVSIQKTAKICQKSVKMYSPLTLYTSMECDQTDLYVHLLPYVIPKQQLQACGFPVENPGLPGKIIVPDHGEDPCERWCCRCGAKFMVSEEGEYQAETICKYHWGKRTSAAGIAGAGTYSCCQKDSMSEGCKSRKHHVSAQTALHNVEFVRTRFKRLPYAVCSKIYALDCEMCYTVQGLEVTRVSLVGVDGIAIYDTYVLPENPVLDYNTTYSGITASDLKDVTTTLGDVQAFLLKLIDSDTMLLGHGLENDLKALRIIHETIVDTSIVFPHHYGFPYKRSLKSLAASYLTRTIQDGDSGHDSVEDARTCLELMLWKICSDRKQAARDYRPFPAVSQCPMQMNPLIIPYPMGFWVPPVGSRSELY